MAYKAKRMRHICSMKGCRNRDVMLISKSGELGGGLYLCRECIENLQKFIPYFDAKAEKKDDKTKKTVEAAKEDAEESATPAKRTTALKTGKGDK